MKHSYLGDRVRAINEDYEQLKKNGYGELDKTLGFDKSSLEEHKKEAFKNLRRNAKEMIKEQMTKEHEQPYWSKK